MHKRNDNVIVLWQCVVLAILLNFFSADAFNLESRAPIVKRGEKGSYFGYSVAQHIDTHNNKAWLLVGAPRGNNLQPGTNRSGALFKCDVDDYSRHCQQVVTDGRRSQGEEDYEDEPDITDYALKAPGKDEIKDGQWLGVTVKSQDPSHGGKVMVCAHRYIKSTNIMESHHGIGLCHLLNGTLDWEEALEPCEGKPMQNDYMEYSYCQAGTSLAFLHDGTALMGAPGPHTWRGTMFAKMTIGEFIERDKNFYSSPLNHLPEPIEKYSYLGMSVTGGRFFSKDKVTYVSGAPRANLTGQVYFVQKHAPNTEMSIRLILKGEQVASNYGYELLAADVNADGYDDLFVAAPFFFNNTMGGAVHIYYNLRHCLANYTCAPDQILYGREESRFGFALASLGDINKDGFNDVAIGAPYETTQQGNQTGAIYIHLGSRSKLNPEPAQKIVIKGRTTLGYSLSGGVDMDNNDYPDLLAGAYNEDEAYLFKTRPIVDIFIEVRDDAEMKNIDVNKKGCKADPKSPQTCFSFNICVRTGNNRLNKKLKMTSNLTADLGKMKGQYIRVHFKSNTERNAIEHKFNLTQYNHPTCQDHTVYIKDGIRDILSPIEFSVQYSLENEPHTPILNQTSVKHFKATFLKDCGTNEVCESMLKISAGLAAVEPMEKDMYELDLGTVDELNVQVNVSNEGESAYEAQLFIIHPNNLSYIALNDKMSDVKCIYYNETWIACNLGNPFRKNEPVHLGLRFENPNNANDAFLEFRTFVNTTSNTTTPETSAAFRVAVKATPNITIDFWSTSYVNYGGILKGESAIKYFDEIGSRVTHIYQVTNMGKWSVNNLVAHIDWPIQIQSSHSMGKWLLYLESVPEVEFESVKYHCEIEGYTANELNYTIRPNQNDNTAPENLMAPLSSFTSMPMPIKMRKTRDIEDEEAQEVDEDDIIPARLMVGPSEPLKNIYTFDCQSNTAKCAKIKCTLPQISHNLGVIIRVVSRLWNSTLIEDFSDKSSVAIRSRMHIVSTALGSSEPERTYSASAVTNAFSTITVPEKSIPWWIIIAACVGGVILLAVTVWLLYCCGFFKRNQLPPHKAKTENKSPEEGKGLLD